jgi:hypothetical protein
MAIINETVMGNNVTYRTDANNERNVFVYWLVV